MISCMDHNVRGALEKVLDLAVSDGFLQPYVEIYTDMKNEGAIDSVKSAVIGGVYNHFTTFYLSVQLDRKERVSEEEWRELLEIFLRRVPEIKSKIDVLLNI